MNSASGEQTRGYSCHGSFAAEPLLNIHFLAPRFGSSVFEAGPQRVTETGELVCASNENNNRAEFPAHLSRILLDGWPSDRCQVAGASPSGSK